MYFERGEKSKKVKTQKSDFASDIAPGAGGGRLRNFFALTTKLSLYDILNPSERN